MAGFLPEGLTKKQAGILAECCKEISDIPLTKILKQAEEHLDAVREAYQNNAFINVRLMGVHKIISYYQAVPLIGVK